MKAGERNPEIRQPEKELPLFSEQSFTKFEQQKSGLSTINPLSAQGETGDCMSLSGHGSPRDKARARKSDPATSHAAARSVNLANLGRTRDALLYLLKRNGPLTDEQIARIWADCEELGKCTANGFPKCSPSGLRSRRAELVTLGFVEAAGGFNEDGTTWGITGKTTAKRNCLVWRLK